MSPDQAIAEDVRTYGFSLITIGDVEPPFAYTAGLMFTHQHPELILFGQRNTGPEIIRGIIQLISEGRRFDKAGVYDGVLEGAQVAVRPVHSTQHEFYLGFAMGYCTANGRLGELEAVEIFWPDRQGRFPFEAECDERVWASQPRLHQPLGRREIGERRAERGD